MAVLVHNLILNNERSCSRGSSAIQARLESLLLGMGWPPQLSTGGNVVHIYLGQSLVPLPSQARSYLKR
jgi:hypothetical protein